MLGTGVTFLLVRDRKCRRLGARSNCGRNLLGPFLLRDTSKEG